MCCEVSTVCGPARAQLRNSRWQLMWHAAWVVRGAEESYQEFQENVKISSHVMAPSALWEV